MKKAIFSAVLTAVLAIAPAVSASDISVVVNGSKIETERPPVITEGRTLVPLRAITEAFGCDVSWDAETSGITLTDGNSLYYTWIGRDYAFKMNSVALEGAVQMEAPPVNMEGFTMVPIRAIGEMFGAKIGWEGETSTVTVDYEKRETEKGLAEKFQSYEKNMSSMYDAYKGYAGDTARTVKAEIQLEDGGVIALELYPDIAPKTVDNFVKLAKDKFYDGLVFHRVIKDFMIQGGGFNTELKQKESSPIKGEFIVNGYFNLIPHNRGVISMARTQDNLDSASSQFFIMHADYHSLDGQYAAFGRVTDGMEYVDKIAGVKTKSVEDMRMDDVPEENQVIKTIVIK